jgi:DNA helicase-2/ATP-dependent DNA helicase PcrA
MGLNVRCWHDADSAGPTDEVIGDEADIPATQRFFVQGQHAQGDRHLNASRTRFIPEKLLGLFERTTWPVVSADTAARTASQGPKLDISARMRGMWR